MNGTLVVNSTLDFICLFYIHFQNHNVISGYGVGLIELIIIEIEYLKVQLIEFKITA